MLHCTCTCDGEEGGELVPGHGAVPVEVDLQEQLLQHGDCVACEKREGNRDRREREKRGGEKARERGEREGEERRKNVRGMEIGKVEKEGRQGDRG